MKYSNRLIMTIKARLSEIIKEKIELLPIEAKGIGRQYYEDTRISIRSHVVDACRFRFLVNIQRKRRIKTFNDKARKSAK